MDPELPIYYSSFSRPYHKRSLFLARSNLNFALKPSEVPQFEAAPGGGPCFVDLPYETPAVWNRDGQDRLPTEKVVFVKGLPSKILFSDRLDSGLCRFSKNGGRLETTAGRYSRGKLGFGDKDFRVWLELELTPGRDRLSNTRVALAKHQFFWKTKNATDEARSTCQILFQLGHLPDYELSEYAFNRIVR